MPGSIPFEAFLHERRCRITLKEADSTTTLRWFLEGGLCPTEQAMVKIVEALFTVSPEVEYRESAEMGLTALAPGVEIYGFVKEDYCWQYPDEKPSVERLQQVLRVRRLRLLSPLEMMHVLWSRPWEQNLFRGQSHFFSLVAMQEMDVMDEALIFCFRSAQPIQPLAFDVSWDDFCCMRMIQPQTILYTKM